MKLYRVTLTHTTVVLADEEREAKRAAESHAIDIVREESPEWRVDREVLSFADLPRKWDGGCIPWNTETFQSVGTVIHVLNQRTQTEE